MERAEEGDGDTEDAEVFGGDGQGIETGVEGFEEDCLALGIKSFEGPFTVGITEDSDGVFFNAVDGNIAFDQEKVVIDEVGLH